MLDALVAEARVRWGFDPADGVQVVPAGSIVATPIEPSRPVLIVPDRLLGAADADVRRPDAPGPNAPRPNAPRLDAPDPDARDPDAPRPDAPRPDAPRPPLPGRHGPRGREPIDLLRRLYPADHLVGRAGVAEGSTVGELGVADFDGPLYLPPLDHERAVASPWGLPWISDRLRRPDGCPWDREQTHESLRKHLLEESYEVYDALGQGATPALAEELGDLLLQIVIHAQLAAEEGAFDLTDVQAAIGRKIVRRHPHVFGDAVARTASDVNRQWERIKAAERAEALAIEASASGPSDVPDGGAAATLADGAALDAGQAAADEAGTEAPPASALDGISRAMPALAASQEMQERAAALGYDWPSIDGIVAKVREELDELLAAESPDDVREELGDLMMVTVNLARRHGVEAEAALRAANDKFRRRFRRVERQAAERGVALRDLDFDQLDELWDRAKQEEAAALELARAERATAGAAEAEPTAEAAQRAAESAQRTAEVVERTAETAQRTAGVEEQGR